MVATIEGFHCTEDKSRRLVEDNKKKWGGRPEDVTRSVCILIQYSQLCVHAGFCNKCNTSFAKLLKRKVSLYLCVCSVYNTCDKINLQHDCNYCGQTYCGSCTVKVKRAVLGATCKQSHTPLRNSCYYVVYVHVHSSCSIRGVSTSVSGLQK